MEVWQKNKQGQSDHLPVCLWFIEEVIKYSAVYFHSQVYLLSILLSYMISDIHIIYTKVKFIFSSLN